MADPLPPDPYLALGVAKDATASAIKTQYRKLVLKCHPDKVTDESEKPEASERFHKIQTAWEIIGDDARRARYDAQSKLHELRKDVFGHHGEGRRSGGGSDVRTAGYKFPTESARGGDFYTRGPDRYGPKMSPQYEERMPSYAEESYFDERPRPASRKYEEYDRSSKRAPPAQERERTRAKESKENDRSNRKEKSRRTDKDIRRDRDRKQPYVEVEPESDYDEYPRARRSSAEDENLERARERFFAPDPYAREAADERARRTFDKLEEAKAHMERSRVNNRQRGESEPRAEPRDPSPRERRPSPVRVNSSREKIERSKRADVRPGLFGIRHGSGDRPKPTRATTGKNSKSDNEKKSSDEDRKASRRKEETRDSKPPTLNKSKTQPPEVRPPLGGRQRSRSMQDEQHDEEPIPQIRRSETTPLSPSTGVPPSRETRRRANDRLHPQDAAYPTPDPTPEPEPQKFRYGREQTYADDGEFATPDGYVNPSAEPYRTQVYEPSRDTQRQSARESGRNTRITRSPSPMKDTDRQGRRSSSARHTPAQKPSMPRTTSTQYIVEPEGAFVRPPVSREDSGRLSSRGLSRENSGHKGLYGEIPRATAARSGSPRGGYTFPPPDDVQYGRRYKESDFKVQAGYRRDPDNKPSYTRQGSGLQRQAVYA